MEGPDLRTKVLSAVRWTAAFRFSAQFMTWAITLVVLRILDSRDYGLMIMAEALFGLLLLLSQGGLSTALIQADEIDDNKVRQMFGALILVNGALFALQFLLAPALAAYYREPAVTPLVRTLALGFLIVPFLAIPSALLSREIEFKQKAAVEMVAAVSASAATLVLALLGYGVWALIVGRLTNLAGQAIGMSVVRAYPKLPLFSFSATRDMLRFGGYYSLTTIAWYFYSHADIFIGGRVLSTAGMGAYGIGRHIANIATSKIMPLLNQVAFPAYARLQNDKSAVAYYFCRVVGVVSLACYPIILGTAVVAPEFVQVVLSDKHAASIVPLILICASLPIRLIGNLFPSAVYGLGRPDVELGNTLFGLAIMPVAFWLGAYWYDAAGLAAAWIVAYPIVLWFMGRRSSRVIRVAPSAIRKQLVPATVCGLAMVGAVMAAKLVPWARYLTPVGELILLIAVGAIVYCGLIWKRYRSFAIESARALRKKA